MTLYFLGESRPTFETYLRSELFQHDLANAQSVWTREHVFRHSAIYVYVNQVCLPDLMEIELKHSQRLTDCQLFARDLERTRLFLRRVVGLEEEERWQGGIANELVQKQLIGVGRQHNTFGLSGWMSSYLGYIIAASALYVLADSQVPEGLANSYMSYMNQAWSLMPVPREDLAKAIAFGETRFGAWDGITHSLQVILTTYISLFGHSESLDIWKRVSEVVHPTVSKLMMQTVST